MKPQQHQHDKANQKECIFQIKKYKHKLVGQKNKDLYSILGITARTTYTSNSTSVFVSDTPGTICMHVLSILGVKKDSFFILQNFIWFKIGY